VLPCQISISSRNITCSYASLSRRNWEVADSCVFCPPLRAGHVTAAASPLDKNSGCYLVYMPSSVFAVLPQLQRQITELGKQPDENRTRESATNRARWLLVSVLLSSEHCILFPPRCSTAPDLPLDTASAKCDVTSLC
jgi:hypothetical protein